MGVGSPARSRGGMKTRHAVRAHFHLSAPVREKFSRADADNRVGCAREYGTSPLACSSKDTRHRGQRRVPHRITVEGITCSPKGVLPDEGVCLIQATQTVDAYHAQACAAVAQSQTCPCGLP